MSFGNGHYNLPPWSISILPGCKHTVYNTARVRKFSWSTHFYFVIHKSTIVESLIYCEDWGPKCTNEDDTCQQRIWLGVVQRTSNVLWGKFIYDGWIGRTDQHHQRQHWLFMVYNRVSLLSPMILFTLTIHIDKIWPVAFFQYLTFLLVFHIQSGDKPQWRIFERWEVARSNSTICWTCLARVYQWRIIRWITQSIT